VATDLKDFRRGDTFLLRFNFGTGVDITGWNITFSLRDTFTSALITSVKRTVGDYPLDEPLNGIFYYFYDSESSKALVPKKYKYDLQLVYSSVLQNFARFYLPVPDKPILFLKPTTEGHFLTNFSTNG